MDEDSNFKKLVLMRHYMSHGHFAHDPIGEFREVLESGYDIDYALPMDYKKKEWRGWTVLHLAAQCIWEGHLYATVDLLLSYGANVMSMNQEGSTPVHLLFEMTSFTSYTDVAWGAVDRLLTAQVESNDATNLYNKDGISHFHIACACDNLKAVEFFLNAGVFINQAISSESRLLPGYTPLHIACRNRGKDIIKLLLVCGGDLSSLNADGMTPLQLIYYSRLRDNDSSHISELRFDSESEKNKFTLAVLPFDTYSMLLNSIELNQLQIECIRRQDAFDFNSLYKLLSHTNINSHVNFYSPVWPGNTALHFAAQNSLQIVNLLLENGADLMAKNANNITALDLCCQMYKPRNVSNLLHMRNYVGSIELRNGDTLAAVIANFASKDDLEYYLTTDDENNQIPFDSPLWPGYSILHLPVLLSQKDQVKMCLEHGADYTLRDVNNMTALHLAFYMNKKDFINDILEAHTNISVNPVDNNNLSHFHIACIAGNASVAGKFLQFGVDPNAPTSFGYIMKKCSHSEDDIKIPAGSTAFHIAAAVKSEDLLKLLVKSTADPNLCDAEGFTWVHRVSFQRKPALYKYLWKHPESVKSNPVAPGGLSHFHIACCTKNFYAVKALLPLTTNINEQITSEIFNFVESKYSGIYRYFQFMGSMNSLIGNTPLHLAVSSSEKIVDLLLKNGADVTVKNSRGENPVYKCCQLHKDCNKRGSNVLKRLTMEFKSKGKSPDGLTALHFACTSRVVSFIKKFLEEEEDFNSQIDQDSEMWPGCTPLSVLIQYDYPKHPQKFQTVKLFLEKFLEKVENSNNEETHELAKRRRVSSSQNQDLVINNNGLTVFHVCCIGSDPVIVERFILSGININAQVDILAPPEIGFEGDDDNSKAGYTALHYAVEYGSDSVLETLLKYKADFNIEDIRGRTPVHLAAELSFDRVKTFLRLCKIDVNMKNTFGHTLLDSLLKNNDMRAQDFRDFLNLKFAFDVDLPNKLFDYLRFWARKFSRPEFEMLMEYIPDVSDVLVAKDSSNQNAIHHFVSTIPYFDLNTHKSVLIENFPINIELLLNKGCELDHQDVNGKTPLHVAVHSKQANTAKILLDTGADINVADNNGMTPYLYCYQESHWDCYDDFDGFETSVHDEMYTTFDSYVDRLQAVGLYLNTMNMRCFRMNCEPLEDYADELNRMAEKKVCKSLSVRTLLTEKLVSEFIVMSVEQRQEILKCLESDELYKEFPNWWPLFKLQFRKILKSVKLLEPALNSLRILLDPRLPDHCLEAILTQMTIYDWINLQKAVS